MRKGRVKKAKLPKKRVSFYTFEKVEDKGYAEKWKATKYACVRGESFEAEGEYAITRFDTSSMFDCNCPARIDDCRHKKMLNYIRGMGLKTGPDVFVYWESDDKEPELMSKDDIYDVWNIPDVDDGADYD